MASDSSARTGYPSGADLESFIRRRRTRGSIWSTIFLLATTMGIIALSALLINIVNDAFGYVAIQSKVPETALVVDYWKGQVLAAPRQINSEDDTALAQGVAARPTSIGFFGHAYYDDYADQLHLLSIDGVAPTAASVESGEYLLSRPLFLYSAQRYLLEKQSVAAFLYYYLSQVNSQISEVGYFPVSQETLDAGLEEWQQATGLTPSTLSDLLPAEQDILVAGSSTIAPLTERMVEGFSAEGYLGTVTVESVGTGVGFQEFCSAGVADIVDASRPISRVELSACREKNGIEPLGFVIGGDGIAVVASAENDFLGNVTREQLQQIFTTADNWSDVDPAWPEKPILRFVPGADSGTLDFFVSQVFGDTLAEQSPETLIAMFGSNVSAGRVRALEATTPLAERTPEDLIALIEAEVIQPKFVATWSLFESIFKRSEIEATTAAIPGAELEFKSWINASFITSPQSSNPEDAGVRTAILGSIFVTIIAALVAIPIGIGAAVYLEEYGSGSRLDQIIETNINNLAGVPSIIYGMLGLAIFVRLMEALTSGRIFGVGDPSTANGRTILSAGLTLGLLVLPLVIINGREAIRAVPKAFREASYGLGATKWQTTWNHVLPNAMGGILTGVILSVSRAFGETAPLIVVGVSTFIVVDPNSPFSKFTTLTVQIYQWTSRPQQEFQHLAAAGIIVLLVLLLLLNATAIYLRNRYSRSY
ncbi:MAG: phosphate ABC transporter permease PstA [Caldilineales bacterium]|nr:phosphate ABC transporter permease PstA [Caldilineales bacterium]